MIKSLYIFRDRCLFEQQRWLKQFWLKCLLHIAKLLIFSLLIQCKANKTFKKMKFWHFQINFSMSIQNVNVARFARNVEWDFFCDFQTLCSRIHLHYLSSHVTIKLDLFSMNTSRPCPKANDQLANELIKSWKCVYIDLLSIWRNFWQNQRHKIRK